MKTRENERLSVKKASVHQQNWVCFAKNILRLWGLTRFAEKGIRTPT
jgi:hypothetical protein